ncbi:MAG: HEAT repeat domain-containing protein [Phycisphaerae bacterium]
MLTFSGCTRPRHYRAAIQSENPGDRILAIRSAGEARDRGAVPLLVDRLEDEDDGVRFFAILALDKITGERLGYAYGDPPRLRAAAVERWRAYVRDGRHVSTGGTNATKNEAPSKPALDQAAACDPATVP